MCIETIGSLSLEKFWKRVWNHRMKPISMYRLLLIVRTMLLVIWQKGKVENTRKQYFTFWKTDPLNICRVKITRKTVNLGDNEGTRIPCLLQFTGNCKMMNTLHNWFVNCRNGFFRVNIIAISVNFLRF